MEPSDSELDVVLGSPEDFERAPRSILILWAFTLNTKVNRSGTTVQATEFIDYWSNNVTVEWRRGSF